MCLVAVLVPEIGHPVIDDLFGAWAAEQGADREAMDHASGRVDAANGVYRIERLAGIVHVEEATLRIDGAILEEIEKSVCLVQQPAPMIGARAPVSQS